MPGLLWGDEGGGQQPAGTAYTRVEVHGLLRRGGEVLLHCGLRGLWSTAWDFTLAGELLGAAAVRVLSDGRWGPGVTVEGVDFAHLAVWAGYPEAGRTRVAVFFWAPVWRAEGEFRALEGLSARDVARVSSEWLWVPLAALPSGLPQRMAAAVELAAQMVPFSELTGGGRAAE